MNLPDRIEWMLAQMIEGEWGGAEGDDFRTLRTEGYMPDAGVVIPFQWMLCTKDVPQARQGIRQMVEEMRQALDGVEALLDTIDAAKAEAATAGHPDWAALLAILRAPFPLERPEVYDPLFLPCVVVMLRDTLFDGSWEAHNRWLEEEGGAAQRAVDLPINHSLQAFEEAYRVNLTDLIFSALDRAEHDVIREEYRRQGGAKLRSRRGRAAGKATDPGPERTWRQMRRRRRRR